MKRDPRTSRGPTRRGLLCVRPTPLPARAAERPFDAERWLVHHATQGFTLAEYERARSMGYEGWLEEQLAPHTIDDSEVERQLEAFPSLGLSVQELYDKYIPVEGGHFTCRDELRRAVVLRSLRSRRQLFERVCEFWSDHFNIDQDSGICNYAKTEDDRLVVRAHALGNFHDLLRASAHSAAMLYYLDNYANVAEAPNENYAREIMELHTLGVDRGYDEHDVKEVARAFTGWTFLWVNRDNHGRFRFNEKTHDDGPKTILGKQLEAGLQKGDGDRVIEMLALHPNTAEYLAGKLANWLLTYDPPAEVVQRAARAYLESKGEIVPMVRAILLPPGPAEERAQRLQALVAPKLRRPYHYLTSLLRATSAEVHDLEALLDELAVLGQLPYDWPTPDGYADSLAAWGDSVYPRWTFASKLLDGGVPGTLVDVGRLFAGVGGFDPRRGAEQIDRVLTGGALDPRDVADVQAFLESHDGVDEAVVREAVALAASSPSYQYY